LDQRVLFAAGIPTLFLASIASAAIVTETFDSAASATANGWVATGDATNGQVAGWSGTNDAGGSLGEGRAQLTKGWPSRDGYRDMTLGGAFTVNDALSFTGKLDYFMSNGDAEQVVLGYSSTTRDSVAAVGFVKNATSGLYHWGVFLTSPNGAATQLDVFSGFDVSRVVAANTDRTVSFAYDPAANSGLGSVTASVSGAGAPITVNLASFQRSDLSDATYDAFGMNRVPLGLVASASNQADFRFDDMTYTVVPEPATAALTLLGGLALARARRRRQR
jgi:hypothetical protein